MTSVDNTPDEYPEHAKVQAMQVQSQAIGEFIDNSGYVLATYEGDRLSPVLMPIGDVLAGYFNIDQQRLEAEKRTMLARLRGENE